MWFKITANLTVSGGIARECDRAAPLGRPPIAPALEKRVREALATPGRPGVRVIAKQFGVDPGTVQRISRPFVAVGYRHHWSLILASWITLAHFSVSATMSFSKSLGDVGIGRRLRRCLSSQQHAAALPKRSSRVVRRLRHLTRQLTSSISKMARCNGASSKPRPGSWE
jgi:hypothetical protein